MKKLTYALNTKCRIGYFNGKLHIIDLLNKNKYPVLKGKPYWWFRGIYHIEDKHIFFKNHEGILMEAWISHNDTDVHIKPVGRKIYFSTWPNLGLISQDAVYLWY
jgi:hypothetical protein